MSRSFLLENAQQKTRPGPWPEAGLCESSRCANRLDRSHPPATRASPDAGPGSHGGSRRHVQTRTIPAGQTVVKSRYLPCSTLGDTMGSQQGAPDDRDPRTLPKPSLDRSLRRGAAVQGAGAGLRRGEGAAPRPRDGRGGHDVARPHPGLLRSRDHGRRDPREIRGRRRHLLHVRPRHRGAGPGRRQPGRARGRAEHPRQQRHPALWQRGDEGEVLPEARHEMGGGLRALRGGLGQRRLRPRVQGRRQGRPLRAHRTQALDHERGGGGALHRDGHPRSHEGLQGHHQLPGGAQHARILGGQEGEQARHPRELHLRADPRRRAGFRRRTCWASRARATRSPSRP